MRPREIAATSIFSRNAASTATTVVNVGGARSSKSHSLAQLLIVRAANGVCKNIGVTRKTMPALRRTAYRLFISLLKEYGLYSPASHNKTEHYYELGGARVQFFSLDEPDKIKSSEFNYIWMEEANEFTRADYITLLTRLSGKPAPGAPVDLGVVAADNTYSASNYLIAAFNSAGYNQKIAAIAAAAQEAAGPYDYYPSGCYVSPQIDGTASLKSWGNIASSGISPAGTAAVIEYRSKANSGDAWGAWTAPGAGGTVPTTERYLQLRWSAASSANQYYSPNLAQWQIDYYTSQTAIPLVNMTGLTCMAALEALAQMCCYEIGFDGTDTFIFRPRYSTMAPLATLGGDEIEKLLELTDGAERVYTRVRVDFGEYSKTVDPATRGDAAPTALNKYGVKELAVSSGNFLPAGNVDLAYAIAPTVYGYVSAPRKRASLACRFFSQYELGDVVRVNFQEADVLRYWLWGDADAYWGRPDLEYYDSSATGKDPMLYGADMRVEGIEFDLARWKTTFDLVEA